MVIWRNLKENKELLNNAARSGAFIIFDTETTGLKKDKDRIIEIAAYKCRFKDRAFRPYDKLHMYINPEMDIPAKATEINGITNEFVADKPIESEAFQKIDTFFGPNPCVGAYNSGFDIKMMSAMYERQGKKFTPSLDVDALKIAKDIFCEQKMKDHKLITVANTYGVDNEIHFHCALDDVEVLLRVINAMIEDMIVNGADRKPEKLKVSVYRFNYSKGYRGYSNLYLNTSYGNMYYDFRRDCFISTNEKPIDINTVDVADIERQMFLLTGCNSYQELKRKCDSGAFDNHVY